MKRIPDAQRRQGPERDALILQWIHLPRHVYARLARRHDYVRRLPPDDGAAYGMIALINAAELWRPERHSKFQSYAYRAIELEVRRRARQDRLIRLPDHVLTPRRGKHTPFMLALIRSAHAGIFSFHSMCDDDDRPFDPPDHHPASEVPPESPDWLLAALDRLTPRQRLVIELRYFQDLTLSAIAPLLGISSERVRQIQEQAMAELRRHLRGTYHAY